MPTALQRLFQMALVIGSLVTAAGCDFAFGLLGVYTGPPPSKADIVAETVIVRTARKQAETGISFFHVDRVRLLNTSPHDINRVVEVTSRDVQPVVEQLGVQVGDTLRISTRYLANQEVGGLGEYVPDWPFDRYDEYTIGFHVLTAVERVGP
jgi:hypothetical protein